MPLALPALVSFRFRPASAGKSCRGCATAFFRTLTIAALAGAAAALSFASAEARAEAPAPSLPAALTVTVGGMRMEFVLIRSGSFFMGSDEEAGDGDEAPRHKVSLTQPFYLGKYEVTQEQWTELMGGNPSRFKGAKRPVETVSWNACQRFLAKFGEKTGLRFALPTEAQWEYACRAGTDTRWSFGAADAPVGDYAWFRENSGGATHPVGEKMPNAWGLYDMSGNVGEWCSDLYAKHTYAAGDVSDPVGPVPGTGGSPVWRGGAWGDGPDYLRCAYRNVNGADGAHHGIGLRCVLLVSSLSSSSALSPSLLSAPTPPAGGR